MLDSKNLPDFDLDQFKGRIEKPISIYSIILFYIILVGALLFLLGRAWMLEIHSGDYYADKSENNRLRHEIIFADRGAVFDRIHCQKTILAILLEATQRFLDFLLYSVISDIP